MTSPEGPWVVLVIDDQKLSQKDERITSKIGPERGDQGRGCPPVMIVTENSLSIYLENRPINLDGFGQLGVCRGT
jgi:hypothetical protein